MTTGLNRLDTGQLQGNSTCATEHRRIMYESATEFEQSAGMERPDVNEDLKAVLDALTVRTKSARLWKLMPQIETRLAEGVQQQDVVDALNEAGLKVSLGTLRTYLYRWRQRQRRQGSPSVDKPAPTDVPTDQGSPNLSRLIRAGRSEETNPYMSARHSTKPGVKK